VAIAEVFAEKVIDKEEIVFSDCILSRSLLTIMDFPVPVAPVM
jgi:hypothetical protein